MLRRTFLLGCGAAPLFGANGPTPAAPQSSAYSLSAAPDGDVYLTWIESEGDRRKLCFSRLAGRSWTPASVVPTGGEELFVNWADHPVVSAGPNGRLLASFSYRPKGAQGSKWGLATRIMFSPDRGLTWRPACDLGADNTTDYTGFVGFWAGSEGFRASYLAPLAKGAKQRDADHIKTLRFAELALDGRLLHDELVDPDVCTCCPLAMSVTSQGPIVVYRDHEAGEIRDISVVRRVEGAWTQPRPVHRDGWKINGCPTNGAAIQADGDRVATAWFTAAGGESRVRVALSQDAGARFGPPITVDGGAPSGWAAVALLSGDRTAVSWLEKRPGEDGVGDVMVRLVDADGKLGRPHSVATVSSGRSSGIPQMAPRGDQLALAWRGDEQVRTALVDVDELG